MPVLLANFFFPLRSAGRWDFTPDLTLKAEFHMVWAVIPSGRFSRFLNLFCPFTEHLDFQTLVL